MSERHTAVPGGLLAGFVGATALAAWFLVLDTLAGVPFHTPAFLGQVLFGPETIRPTLGPLALLTFVHYLGFMVLGILTAWIIGRLPQAPSILVDRGRQAPHLLVAAALMFVVAAVLFLGFLAIAGEFLLEVMTLWSIASGNLLAALGMGLFLGRRHPDLVSVLNGSALGWGKGQEDPA